MSVEGFGVIVAFQSGFFAEITDVQLDGFERKTFDKTSNKNVATTSGWMEFYFSKMKDPGGLTIEILHNPNVAIPINADPETITVTIPVVPGGSTSGTIACTGGMTKYTFKAPKEGLIAA